jgi:hypothetical protein
MKKILLILSLALAVIAADAKKKLDSLKQFFDSCKTDYNLEQIKVGKFVMKLIQRFSDIDKENKAIISSIKQICVLSPDGEISEQNKQSIINNLYAFVEKNGFEKQLEVNNKGLQSEIFWQSNGKYGYILIANRQKDNDDEMRLIYFKVKGKELQKNVANQLYEELIQ